MISSQPPKTRQAAIADLATELRAFPAAARHGACTMAIVGSEFSDRLSRASRGSMQSRIVTILALGWAKLWRAEIRFDTRTGIFVCHGMRGGFGRGGTTIGGAYLTRDHTRWQTLRHEAVHADQWGRYGFSFAIRYLLEEMRHPKERNKFEIEAGLEDGGYRREVGRSDGV